MVLQSHQLQWRHNERDGVSNHRRLVVCSTVCSGADQRTGLYEGNPPMTVRPVVRAAANTNYYHWKMKCNVFSCYSKFTLTMAFLTEKQKCGLRMRWECRERFPRHRFQRKPLVSNSGMHQGTCVTHVPWCWFRFKFRFFVTSLLGQRSLQAYTIRTHINKYRVS